MMHPARRLGAGATLAVSAALVLAAASPVSASGVHVRHGHCSGSATWAMEVYREDGRLEIEIEIDTIEPAGPGA